jgi:catechol 2,3-dioxygenase-like lactoylglutathione lyase family enzyme
LPGEADPAVIDHVKVFVGDFERRRDFYERALDPLGYRLMMEPAAGVAGFGAGFPFFWIEQSDSPTTAHVAFRAEHRTRVDAFHAAALAAGGDDNGAPGVRPQYHPGYYGAFVHDPDGNNIEAVCHR